ncbi:hypothetical protein BABINDRAFT_104130 [Babjeviella inositovora NRRL Y-12698]|uniref:Guanine nucleotide-binding protein subunit gamma n=1 Tax=Babjeviella inositovora NRRL Y-12698 TaxID=984486 RepID=A0A1E3QHT8_9ASCO|nr:uncharacterized protein BABINDRAFT_104130 [Babjeviella inositovora NRRL Y-12698]ODQ77259.1 hypothetical protein BABINDRAFT_104130 [Babjeviella inositovora NRRL Y-12698]
MDNLTQTSSSPAPDFQERINEIRLQRVLNLNQRLRADLKRERITASNACLLIIDFTRTKPDYLVPEVWGQLPPSQNNFHQALLAQRGKSRREDLGAGCCVIV